MNTEWIDRFKNKCIERTKNIIELCKSVGYSDTGVNIYVIHQDEIKIVNKSMVLSLIVLNPQVVF